MQSRQCWQAVSRFDDEVENFGAYSQISLNDECALVSGEKMSFFQCFRKDESLFSPTSIEAQSVESNENAKLFSKRETMHLVEIFPPEDDTPPFTMVCSDVVLSAEGPPNNIESNKWRQWRSAEQLFPSLPRIPVPCSKAELWAQIDCNSNVLKVTDLHRSVLKS